LSEIREMKAFREKNGEERERRGGSPFKSRSSPGRSGRKRGNLGRRKGGREKRRGGKEKRGRMGGPPFWRTRPWNCLLRERGGEGGRI